MNLKQLIDRLQREPDKTRIVRNGFSFPHSYRGYYNQLAFEPTQNVTVNNMLDDAMEALGSTYTGYKGGYYTMDNNSTVNLANYGEFNDDDEITEEKLDAMLGTALKQITTTHSLTNEELEVLQQISLAHKAFASLPQTHPDDIRDFVNGVHIMQGLLMRRLARRAELKMFPNSTVEVKK